MKTVIVAMSGGVDSSITAYKLLEEGYNVIGTTLSMGIKCDKNAIEDAKKVAEKLKIKHFTIDVKNSFEKNVINYFTNSYLNGETPNPCAVCNRFIKFKEIIDFMKEINANFIATGHYANIIKNGDIYELHKATDKTKDQSYFLSTLDYDFLQYIKFPLHSIQKTEVKKLAQLVGLHVAKKAESQDACFVETNYKNFIQKNCKNYTNKEGLIKHVNGEILGKYDGIINFTIGQRKGLNISYKNPIYVVKIDTKENIVYVGNNEDLFSDKLTIKNVNILNNKLYEKNKTFTFKLRSTHIGQNGIISYNQNNNTAEIILNEQTRAITKGQLCTIYDNSLVIASGWII